jgi:hypothetical protein
VVLEGVDPPPGSRSLGGLIGKHAGSPLLREVLALV